MKHTLRIFSFAITLGATVASGVFAANPVVAPAPPSMPINLFHQVYFDDFNGPKLSDNWEIIGGDPSTINLLDGQLVISTDRYITTRNHLNFPGIRLKRRFPDDTDWRVTMRFSMAPSTNVEQLSLVLYNQFDTHLAANYYFSNNQGFMALTKVENDIKTRGGSAPIGLYTQTYIDDIAQALAVPTIMEFGKQGDLFYVKGRRENWPDYYEWANAPIIPFDFSSAHSRLALGLYQYRPATQPTIAKIDWIKIEFSDSFVRRVETPEDVKKLNEKMLEHQQMLTDKAKEAAGIKPEKSSQPNVDTPKSVVTP